MGGGCTSEDHMKKEEDIDESSIQKIIKECMVEQEASLKVVISGHVEKLESQLQDLKKMLIQLNNFFVLTTTKSTTTPHHHHLQPEEDQALDGSVAAAAPVGDDNEPAEEEQDDDDDDDANLLLPYYGADHHHLLGVSKTQALPPASSPTWKYDIFISFRGDDTRRGFASHLFHALKNADINCYRDVDGNERGQLVWPMLKAAIHHSMMAIVLFSKKYADSKWCLKELVEILRFNEQYRAYGHTVLPIFYDVGPSQVRNQSGIVKEAFQRCRAKTKQQKQQWRDALEKAGNLSSWHLVNDANGDEAEFIEKIVEELQNRVFYSRSPYFVKSPVGTKDNMDHLISLLDTHSKCHTISKVGIYGAEGIGKTTLAKLICSRLYSEFEGQVSLLENIHNVNINKEGIVRLQNKLLQDVMKIKRPLSLSDGKGKNVSEIRKRLNQKKILLVLDGVDKSHQMLSIIGGDPEKFLLQGSIIIITTRDKQLLEDLKVDKIDMIPPLGPQDSLQLFYQHAFIEETTVAGSDRYGLDADYEDMSKNLVHYAGGLPLALHTLGSFMFGKPKDVWHQMLKKLVRSTHLDSIGVYYNSVSPLHTYQKVGPYGGRGSRYDHGRLTTVRKVHIFLTEVSDNNKGRVHAMVVDYDYNGSFISPGRDLRREESVKYFPVTLDYPDEYLTSVSGYIDGNYQLGSIRSIKFYSNKRDYGPYGEEQGTFFTFPNIESGSIVGLFGCDDPSLLNSIGAYFGPVPNPSPYTTVGPFGRGKCWDDGTGKYWDDGTGKYWDDGKHLDIRSIKVLVGDSEVENQKTKVIKSICITYDNYGHPLGPFSHGDDHESGEYSPVPLDYPYEYLTAISGYVNNGIVSSLTFHSNKVDGKYGPYGDQIGQRFFTPQSTGVKIVGFFGANDTITGRGGGQESKGLKSIGVHLEAVSHIHPKRVVGPLGDQSGHGDDDGDCSDNMRDHRDCSDNMRELRISWGSNGIRAVTVSHVNDDHLDYDPTSSILIELGPKEYIKAMEGWFYVKPYGGDAVIRQLTFESNIDTYGPYGTDKNSSTYEYDTYFRTPWNVGKITGFYGTRSGDLLSSIGAYFAPVYHFHPLETIGPFGDYFSGDRWDDERHSDVRRIELRFGWVIDSILLVYEDEKGGSFTEKKHGGDGGDRTKTITLDPDEYLVGMTGHIGTLGDCLCVRSLTFETNKPENKYGPYGSQEGKYFSFKSNIGKIVGFYGTSSTTTYLFSIGAHVQLL